MAKKSNIVFQYFKKEDKGYSIFIQFDPISLSGCKLTVQKNGEMELEDMEFEPDLAEELINDGFMAANALEFHILVSGLAN